MPQSSPKLCRHKQPKGIPDRAYVTLSGSRHYLGQWGSREAKEAYNRLLAEWHAGNGALPPSPDGLLVVNLCAAFLRHAKGYYVDPNGKPTTSLGNCRVVIRRLRGLYGSLPAVEFGPKNLRAVRDTWVADGLARSTVNGYAQVIKQIFKFGVAHELIPASVFQALQAVDGLKQNRSKAKEAKPVMPVPDAHIEAVHLFVSRQIWALIQVGLHTGARPGEYLALRATDLDTSGDIWTYRPARHKNTHRGKDRVVFFGPRAQAAIQPFMTPDRPVDKPLFSPREAEQERKAKGLPQMKGRKQASPRRPDQVFVAQTNRVVRDAYDTDSYRGAIAEACKKAIVPHWTPNQLRHNAATLIREKFGIDTAGTVLGHSIASAVTAVYAESSRANAMRAIREVG